MKIRWFKRATLRVSVKNRNDYADYDYIDKLGENELQWLKNFHNEYYQASFISHTVFKTKELRLLMYHFNNCRNRDVYNYMKICHSLITGENADVALDDKMSAIHLRNL